MNSTNPLHWSRCGRTVSKVSLVHSLGTNVHGTVAKIQTPAMPSTKSHHIKKLAPGAAMGWLVITQLQEQRKKYQTARHCVDLKGIHEKNIQPLPFGEGLG